LKFECSGFDGGGEDHAAAGAEAGHCLAGMPLFLCFYAICVGENDETIIIFRIVSDYQ
jgi:hypothetical protein